MLKTCNSLGEAAKLTAACERLSMARDLLHLADHGPSPSPAVSALTSPTNRPLLQEALTQHLDHRPLDYFDTPPQWGTQGISPVNAVGPFVASEPTHVS